MSVAIEQTATMLKERAARSTRRFYEALGLDVVTAKNLPYLTIALTEATTEEIAHNRVLRESIRSLYQELLPSTKVPTSRTGRTPGQVTKRTPNRTRSTSSLAPGEPPDLEALARNFSPDEWRTALSKYNKESLNKAVAILRERYPSTRLTNLSTKEALVGYILTYMPRMA